MMFSFFYSAQQLVDAEAQMGLESAVPNVPMLLPMLGERIRELGGFQQQVGVLVWVSFRPHMVNADFLFLFFADFFRCFFFLLLSQTFVCVCIDRFLFSA